MSPTGWKLVPIEPTPEMLRAYRGALKRYIDALPDDVRLPGKRGLIIDDTIKAQQRFKAMVAVAPEHSTDIALIDWQCRKHLSDGSWTSWFDIGEEAARFHLTRFDRCVELREVFARIRAMSSAPATDSELSGRRG